jgi:hypothetical protein
MEVIENKHNNIKELYLISLIESLKEGIIDLT